MIESSINQCFQDPQALLAEAAATKNIKKFKVALLNGGDPDLVDPQTGVSLFERLCLEPDSAIFLNECLKNGSNVSKINKKTDKYPIHLACQSLDPFNIEIIADTLTRHKGDVNVKCTSTGLTGLLQIANAIKKDNVRKCCDCIKVLVKNGGNVNVPDAKDQTVPLILLKKLTSGEVEIKDTLQYILKNCVVDLDTYRDAEARKRLTDKCPELESLIRGVKDLNPSVLASHIRNRREADFLHDLDSFMSSQAITNVEECNSIGGAPTLLELAVEEGLVEAVKTLIGKGANVNRFTQGNMSPIKLAAMRGHYDVLQELLKAPEIQLASDPEREPILCTIIKKLGETKNRDQQYQKCFDILVEHPGINVNEADTAGNTALHFACRYRNKDATIALLQKRAYIGMQNALNSIAIDDIDPLTLERHLDNCITTNHARMGDDDFEIEIDFSNFLPVKPKTKMRSEFQEEMPPIIAISKTKELKHLMTHPLITSFLFIKWHRLFKIFLINLIFYAIFCTSLVVYVVFFYGKKSGSGLQVVFVLITIVGLLLLTARELMQLCLNPWKYIRLPENYLEVSLIIMTIVVLVTNIEGGDMHKVRLFAALTVLLAAFELSLLISSLPNVFISTHIVMLKRVSWSFMRSLSINSVTIVAFAFCFYTLFGGSEQADRKVNNGTDAGGDEETDNFNSFGNPQSAIIKTIVMMTGEFEAAAIKFDENQGSYLVFLIFVFFMSIVLFNLLNGLAVSDTQVIKAEAEQCHFTEKASTLYRFENSLLTKNFSFFPPLRSIAENFICVFPHFLPQCKILVYPNDGNRIKVPVARPKADYNGTDTSVLIDGSVEKYDLGERASQNCVCQSCLGCCSRMDRKIIKKLLQRIDLRERSLHDDEDKFVLQKKLENMEARMVQMDAALKELTLLIKSKF